MRKERKVSLLKSSLMLLAATTIMPFCEVMAQEKPQVKIDFSFFRNKPAETQEPGYTEWYVQQGVTDTQTFEGVTFTLSIPSDVDYVLRQGWNKTYVQQADYKEKNGRLLFDGVTLDPNSAYGSIIMKIEGLPVGQHNIITYHSNWNNPTNTYSAPMAVKVNGQLVHENVAYSYQQPVAANATLLKTTINIENAGDVAELEFFTSSANPGVADNGQTNAFNAPILNGLELNTIDVTAQAKEPLPANGDMHVDADDKTVEMSWAAANESVKQHVLYIGTDSVSVADMTTPVATFDAATTSYVMNNPNTQTTYFWRVDEVDAADNVTKGQIWSFRTRQLAFPGAEGYGRFAHGGRGGTVYHVTSLSGANEPGTFLYGLTNNELGPRTIVFDVSGIIELDFSSHFASPNVYIAGQTAPGKGICIKKSNINIGSDNICRHMRFKHGYGDTSNAMGMSGSDHAIVDHTTAAWGTDETVSGRGAKNVSFQYSMIAEALGIADHKNYGEGTNHGFAATIDGKIGSWHHNLLVNCNGRNWSMGGGMDGQNKAIGQMDLFNNVVYNWNGRTTDGNCHEVNFVNNYYKMGPDTRRKELFIQQYENVGHEESTWRAYVSGNIRENKDGSLTHDKEGVTYTIQLSNGDPGPDYDSTVDEPFFPSYAKIHSAQDAFKVVTSEAGATMPVRDDQHLRVVDETIDGTYTYVGSRSGIKGEIDHEDDQGGWETYPEETRAADFDTDQDGMPNWFEKLAGSNPDVADNNNDPDGDGWTLLEDYLEFMANPYILVAPNAQGTFDAAPWFRGFKNSSPEYSIATDSDLFTASVSGSTITVNTKGHGGIGIVTMKVKDSAGTTHEKRLSVAVTGETTGIDSVWDEKNINVAKREFFTLDGKQVNTMKQHEVYVMKITDTKGKVHSVKIIKN